MDRHVYTVDPPRHSGLEGWCCSAEGSSAPHFKCHDLSSIQSQSSDTGPDSACASADVSWLWEVVGALSHRVTCEVRRSLLWTLLECTIAGARYQLRRTLSFSPVFVVLEDGREVAEVVKAAPGSVQIRSPVGAMADINFYAKEVRGRVVRKAEAVCYRPHYLLASSAPVNNDRDFALAADGEELLRFTAHDGRYTLSFHGLSATLAFCFAASSVLQGR